MSVVVSGDFDVEIEIVGFSDDVTEMRVTRVVRAR